MNQKMKKIHFIGIGGIGMSGIAHVLIHLGYSVSGSDQTLSDITHSLEQMGATIYKNHQAHHVGHADTVVISAAIRKNNPELLKAKERNLSILSRAAMLGFLMKQKKGLAVSGTHGKTTTS